MVLCLFCIFKIMLYNITENTVSTKKNRKLRRFSTEKSFFRKNKTSLTKKSITP